MINKKIVREVTERLVKVYDPVAIYLFGSYAWGIPTENSDLDLLIVVENSNQSPYERAAAGHLALCGVGISKDIIVRTRKHFEKNSKDITTLSYKIKHEGKPIYEKAKNT